MSIEWVPFLIIVVFPACVVVTAIVAAILFGKDGADAKAEGRSRKSGVTVFFIVSMSLLAVVAILTITAIALTLLVMRSM